MILIKKKNLFVVVLSFILLVSAFVFTSCNNYKNKEYIGIISALDNEIQVLLDEAEVDEIETYGGVEFYIGKLKGKDVIITKAGVGKIRSASGVSVLISRYNISKVIFTGIAGGLLDEEKVLDVVIATKLVEHDYGTLENDGFIWTSGDPGVSSSDGAYYECDANLIKLATESASKVVGEGHVFNGIIATGDQFIANEAYVETLRENYDAYACDMESAAIVIICANYNIPTVVIRTLSDKADGNAHESIADFGDVAAYNSSNIVLDLLEKL